MTAATAAVGELGRKGMAVMTARGLMNPVLPPAAGGGVTEELAPPPVSGWKLLLLGSGSSRSATGSSLFTPTESAPYRSLITGGTGSPVSSCC